MSRYKEILNEMKSILGMDPLSEEAPVEEVILEETPIVDTTEVELAEATLEDGTIVYFDGEWGLETAVFIDEVMEVPVEDGEYVLESGDKFVIAGGLITEITPMEVEAPEEVPEEVPMGEDFEKMYNDLLVVVEEMKQKLNKFEEQEVLMKSQIEQLSAEPEVESISQQPQEKRELSALEKRLNTLDAIRRLKK